MNTNMSVGLVLVAVCGSLVSLPSHAGTLKNLLSFDGANGAMPEGSVIGYRGLRYGTTSSGGSDAQGTIYWIDGKTGATGTLYTFTGGFDGSIPLGNLVPAGSYLYGVTWSGTVFKVNISTGDETTIYRFVDGSTLSGGFVYYQGKFYGTTLNGGKFGYGSLFVVDPKTGIESTKYSFKGGADGQTPEFASLIVDVGQGLLYGATQPGGGFGGTLFRYDPATHEKTVLHAFDAAGSDGFLAAGPLAINPGTYEMYGTTTNGGANGYGTVYAVNIVSGYFSVLYNFTGAADGGEPMGGVTYLGGQLYGTASIGGSGGGTLFQVDPSSNAETTLYSFPGAAGGEQPGSFAGLTWLDGKLLGTTYTGGPGSDGTVFTYRP